MNNIIDIVITKDRLLNISASYARAGTQSDNLATLLRFTRPPGYDGDALSLTFSGGFPAFEVWPEGDEYLITGALTQFARFSLSVTFTRPVEGAGASSYRFENSNTLTFSLRAAERGGESPPEGPASYIMTGDNAVPKIWESDGGVLMYRSQMDGEDKAVSSGGSGGTTNYNALQNRPQINGVTLQGNRDAASLGLVTPTEMAGAISVGVDAGVDVASQDAADKASVAQQAAIDDATAKIAVEAQARIDGDTTLTIEVSEIRRRLDGQVLGYAFDTEADMYAALDDPDFAAKLLVGTNLYIRDINAPDYWWDGERALVLEDDKVDLTNYYTKAETTQLLSGKADSALMASQLSAKLDKAAIVQEPGASTAAVMSQDAVTRMMNNALGDIGTALDAINGAVV